MKFTLLFAAAFFAYLASDAAEVFVDPLNGDDVTGNGAELTPYRTPQGAIDDAAGWHQAPNIVGGNAIWIANTAEVLLSAPIDFKGLNTAKTPLVIEGYDAGGGLGPRVPDGKGGTVQIAGGVINGQGSIGYLFAPGSAYLSLRSLELKNASQYAVWISASTFVEWCEVSGGAVRNIQATSNTRIFCSYIHGAGATNVVISGGGRVVGCKISGAPEGINFAGGTVVAFCEIEAEDEGIKLSNAGQSVRNCDITAPQPISLFLIHSHGAMITNNRLMGAVASPVVQANSNATMAVYGNNWIDGAVLDVNPPGIVYPDVADNSPSIGFNADPDNPEKIGFRQDHGPGGDPPSEIIQIQIAPDGRSFSGQIIEGP